MAPEQIEGQDADARTDIFAFGSALYEMLTGRRAFQGKSQVSVMAAILEQDPPAITLHGSACPPGLERIVNKCLAKDPAERWQCAADLGSELTWAAEELGARLVANAATAVPASSATWRGRKRLLMAAAVLGTVVAGGALTWLGIRWTSTSRPQPVRFAIVPPPAQPLAIRGLDRDIAVSPDGSRIVYVAGAGQVQLMVRSLDQVDAVPLRGLISPRAPFISPDGRWVGFFSNDLRKVSVTGGPSLSLCRVERGPRGASWGDDETIVFATADPKTGLMRVPAGGGEPQVLTKPDRTQGEQDHLWPSMLPEGRGILFTITAPGSIENAQIAVLDLKSGQRKTLIRGGSHAEYVSTGHLVYGVSGSLRAVPFDLARLEVLGDPVPVVEQVVTTGTGAANFGVSKQGSLVYVPGGAQNVNHTLVWVNRQGREEPLNAPPRNYVYPRLSPDGKRVALDVRDQEQDIWVWDIVRQTLTRLTFDAAVDQYPVWTPDGRRIAFTSARDATNNLFSQAADGTGAVERLTKSTNPQFPYAFSPDASRIVVGEAGPQGASGLSLVVLQGPSAGLGAGERRTEPLVQTPFAENNADISPDGRWLVYQSNESGADEIYVRPFPKVEGGRWQISTGGGSRPVWARNGRELFYLDGGGRLMVVPVQAAPGFSAGNAAKLFDTRYFSAMPGRTYDVSPDGQRFLMIKDNALGDQSSTPASLLVVLNWFEELKARVPAQK